MPRHRAADRRRHGCIDRRAGGAAAADPPPAEQYRIVEFADLDLTDYNAPISGRRAARCQGGARAVAQPAVGAAPDAGGADLIRLRKIPSISTASQSHWPARRRRPCSLNGNLVTTGEDYDAWRYTLEKTVRKELERSWRVFTRDPAASFAIITDTDEALRILSTTEVQQGTRMQSLGRTTSSMTRPARRSTATWCATASATAMRWSRRSRSATRSWRRCSASGPAHAT
jgi:CelD/BcsL family acetyltransferase involved in cellulose biosynthesis